MVKITAVWVVISQTIISLITKRQCLLTSLEIIDDKLTLCSQTHIYVVHGNCIEFCWALHS